MLKTHQHLSEFYAKKLLGVTALKTQFRDVIVEAARNFAAHVWGTSGLFAAVDLDITVADEFSCITAPDGVDNSGSLTSPPPADVTSITFENTNAVVYHAALARAVVKSGVETNPRTGAVHYQAEEEIVGVVGTPDLITADPGGTGGMMFVDSICEVGVSCSGRTVRVYLNAPLSAVEAVAFEDLVVAWDGGNNYINVAGNLGQNLGAFSEVVGDYTVALLGPMVKRNTDLSLDATVVYLGTVTGGGAGNPPSAKNTDGQRVFSAGGLAALAEVLEQDAHGFWKLRVKADASDLASDRQIAVENATGSEMFAVMEDGSVSLRNIVGADSPTLIFLNNWGAVKLNASGGILRIMDGSVRIDDVLNALNVLSFSDVNAAVAVPFSGAAPDNVIDALLPQNLLGGINRSADQERILDAAIGTELLSGFALSNGGGLSLDYATGVAVVNGKRVSIAGSSLALPDNKTSIIYLDATDGAIKSVALSSTPAAEDAILGQVETAGGAITLIQDGRIFLTTDHVIDEIGVGIGHQFTKLSAAVEALGVNALAGKSQKRVIRLFGDITEAPADLPISVPSNVVLDGQGNRVTWSGDVALFKLNGSDGATIKNFALEWSGNSAADGTQSRVAFLGATTPSDRVTIKGIVLTKTGTGFYHGLFKTGQVTDRLVIADCVAEECKDFGIKHTAGSPSAQVCVRDSYFIEGASVGGPDVATGGVEFANVGGIINNCGFRLFTGPGVNAIGVPTQLGIRNVRVDGSGQAGIVLSGNHTFVAGCRLQNCGGSMANSYAVSINGSRNFLVENNFDPAAVGVPKAVHTSAASRYNIVARNQFNGSGYLDDAPAGDNTFENNRNDA